MMQKFSWRFAILLGFTGILTNTFWVAFNAYVPIFLQSGHPLAETSNVVGFALSPFVANFIMTWDNIIHMFLNPLVGARSDHTWNRFGRRKPWLFIGFPIAAFGFILIPYATSIAAIMLFIMLTNLGTGLYRTPLKAWVGDFYSPEDRSKGEAAYHLMGGLAVVIVSVLGGILFDRIGRAAPFFLSLGLMSAAAAFVIIWVREAPPAQTDTKEAPAPFSGIAVLLRTLHLPENRRLRYATISVIFFVSAHAAFQANMTVFGTFELQISTGRAAQLAGIPAIVYVLSAIPSSLLADRLGIGRVMLAGMLLYAASSLLMFFFAKDAGSIIIPLIVIGFAWALVSVNGLPLLLNFDRENRAGLFTGLFYFAFQVASILGPLVAGTMVSISGSQRALMLYTVFAMLLAFAALSRVGKFRLD